MKADRNRVRQMEWNGREAEVILLLYLMSIQVIQVACVIRESLLCLIYNAENFPVFSFHFTNKYHRSISNRKSKIDPP